MDEVELLTRKQAKFWIHRILAEKTQELKKLSERIGELNHQAEQFDKMIEPVQNMIMDELNYDFRKYEWHYRFTEKEVGLSNGEEKNGE